ncbi:MAG: DUF1572 domain-containing protein [Acidobacteria bacterium]|nr:DUF1572 domain-containing protein [Acidobacteriota bacterium]
MKDFIDEFERYRIIAEKAMEQVSDDSLNQVVGDGGNSIAVIVRHISGNLISRFTDFLTSDGEKPWRNRDSEFDEVVYSRKEITDLWNKGWEVLRNALSQLNDSDLQKQVTIRGHSLTVQEALLRSVTHTAHHIGQIVLLARILKGAEWKSLSIPRNKSL